MAKPQKPILADNQSVQITWEPVLDKSKKSFQEWKWVFSFRYWEQIEYFGLDTQDPKWFVSFLEKVKDLSKENRNFILDDYQCQQRLRYHKINWKQKNIPISRSDLSWVDTVYLDNSDEYEFYQFQISQALGRIIGFWDENLIFNIVLLDPLHNIQPSKNYGYKIDKCSRLSCNYTELLSIIDKSNNLEEVKEFLSTKYPTDVHILMHFINEELYEKVYRLKEEGKIISIEEILEFGCDFIEENSQ